MKMNDPRRGITVQATVVAGGTVSNVVPRQARAEVDIRYARLADAPKIDRKLHSLRPILKGARMEVRGGVNRPPLERTPAVQRTFSPRAIADARNRDSRWAKLPRAAARTEISQPRSACRRSMASARWAMARTARTNIYDSRAAGARRTARGTSRLRYKCISELLCGLANA